jgi:hypothetical protein
MSLDKVIHPDYIRIVERKIGGWLFKGKLFSKRLPIDIDFYDFELLYGVSTQQVVIELFRINGGQAGYYLANLRDRSYYYCRTSWQDVKVKLRELGIGRNDPMGKKN